jgi:membrane protein required for colicin V production
MEQYISNFNISEFNWFDISLVSVVFISTVFAVFRGFIKAVFSLVTWGVSVAAAVYFYPSVHEILAAKIHNQKLAIIASSIGVFVIFFAILVIVNVPVIRSMRKITGGFFDRFFGFCFGAARGVLIICLIFFSISLTSKMLHLGKDPDRPGPEWFAKSVTYPILEKISATLVALAPEDMPKHLEQTVDKFKDVTLASLGEELQDSSGNSKTLSEEDRKTIKEVILALSKEDLAEVYKKYDSNPSGISEFEKIEIFKEIISIYKKNLQDNKIESRRIVEPEKLQLLEKSLNFNKSGDAEKPAGSAGYKTDSVNQMERLVDGIK